MHGQNDAGGPRRSLSPQHIRQVEILRAMSAEIGDAKQLEIGEIARIAGFNDEREVLRHLYILEGHKWVCPFPKGDLTSRRWHLTGEGQHAARQLSRPPLT